MAYLELSQLKARFTPDLGADKDQVLTDLLVAAERVVDSVARRTFGRAPGTKLFDGSGRRTLFITDLAAAPSQVRVRDSMAGGWRVVPAGDVLLGPVTREAGWPAEWLEMSDAATGPDGVWPAGNRTVEITGDWGWPSVPAEIAQATGEIAVALYRARGAGLDPQGVDELAQATRTSVLPPLARALLMGLRRPLVA